MRIGTLLIIIFIITIITIQLYAFLELYKKLKNKAKHKNAINSANNTDRPKNAISIETLDLDKLKFDSYLREFNKTYNQEEYMRRFKNFKVSLEEILNLNLIKLENKTIYGLTKYSDMSKEEFQFDSYLRNVKTNDDKTDIDVDVLDLDKLRFDIYLRDFDKTYNKEEYQRRFKNFKASLTDIARLNKLENNKVFGLTKFSDMSKEEFAERMLLKPIDIAPCNPAHPRSCSKPQIQNKPSRNKKNWNDIPKSFDWRTRKGFVKPVLNQKECQGCWAFGIVGVMETMAAIQLNDTRSRSIQELLDCSAYNHGCNKGSVSEAMLFMCRHQLQFVTEEEYPMKLPIEKECRQAIDTFRGIRVKRYDHTCVAEMVTLVVEDFGVCKEKSVKKFTWKTSGRSEVSVISYGAIIQSIKIPNRLGVKEDVVLGFDDLDGYVNRNIPYLGATVGRCANRIGNATFDIDGQTYNVAKNVGKDHLHGGIVGFDKAVWDHTIVGTKVVFSYLSKDLEEGYPGDLVTTVTYEVTDDNKLLVDFKASTTKKTVVNLTNHSYFNLAGHDGGAEELYNHYVVINADKITKTDSNSIPTGGFIAVQKTPFDFTVQKKLGDAMSAGANLFDDNYCIETLGKQVLTLAASVTHPPSGRFLEVHTDQPGVQFYTGNSLPAPTEPALVGKNGVGYRRHGAFCLETQTYPDAVHHTNFPTSILVPGEQYLHRVVYKFGVYNPDKVVEAPSVTSA